MDDLSTLVSGIKSGLSNPVPALEPILYVSSQKSKPIWNSSLHFTCSGFAVGDYHTSCWVAAYTSGTFSYFLLPKSGFLEWHTWNSGTPVRYPTIDLEANDKVPIVSQQIWACSWIIEQNPVSGEQSMASCKDMAVKALAVHFQKVDSLTFTKSAMPVACLLVMWSFQSHDLYDIFSRWVHMTCIHRTTAVSKQLSFLTSAW